MITNDNRKLRRSLQKGHFKKSYSITRIIYRREAYLVSIHIRIKNEKDQKDNFIMIQCDIKAFGLYNNIYLGLQLVWNLICFQCIDIIATISIFWGQLDSWNQPRMKQHLRVCYIWGKCVFSYLCYFISFVMLPLYLSSELHLLVLHAYVGHIKGTHPLHIYRNALYYAK